jgi:UPF0755 protein
VSWRGPLLAGSLALLCLGAVAYAGARWALTPLAMNAPDVLFVVEPGQPLAAISRNLERAGLVRRARAVELLARFRALASELRAGEYRLNAAMTPDEILGRIARGQIETYPVVLPEGLRASEIGARLESAGLANASEFLAVVFDPTVPRELGVEGQSLEGYLFPETYRMPRGLSAKQVARVLVDQFRVEWQKLEPLAARRDFSMREVVTLASIVEKETGAAEERPLIASVFHNRLDRNMRLESDPTTIYGIPNFDGNLRRRDLENGDNPYNTYRIQGLPPGPISNPGADALRAVVDPASSDYLYFVSKNDGTHSFSRSYREHVNAVNRYQRRRSR